MLRMAVIRQLGSTYCKMIVVHISRITPFSEVVRYRPSTIATVGFTKRIFSIAIELVPVSFRELAEAPRTRSARLFLHSPVETS